jgi:hypothetical protein
MREDLQALISAGPVLRPGQSAEPEHGTIYLMKKERGMRMDESLTPDEDVVFREFLRLDVEPHQIPVDLHAGFMKRLARSCNMSLARTRSAVQGLIDKGKFDISDETQEE